VCYLEEPRRTTRPKAILGVAGAGSPIVVNKVIVVFPSKSSMSKVPRKGFSFVTIWLTTIYGFWEWEYYGPFQK